MVTLQPEMNVNEVRAAVEARQLEILGGFNTSPDDPVPAGTFCILMLGPKEPGFWERFTQEQEYLDGKANPLDRWSRRVTDDLAHQMAGTAIYPSDGPPYAPFFDWALRTERIWQSPVTLLIHESAGLMVSFRAALALPLIVDVRTTAEPPCDSCIAQPCRVACPVSALTDSGYNVDACHSFLNTPDGSDCLDCGCKARRACPVSQSYGRVAEQSAFHMRAFHTG